MNQEPMQRLADGRSGVSAESQCDLSMAAAPVADGLIKPLDEGFISAERVASLIATMFLSCGGLIGVMSIWVAAGLSLLLACILLGAWMVVTGVLVWLSMAYPRWVYNRTRYRVSPLGIEIRRGIFWRTVINVPRSRVQHTDVTQGPLMRRFGIAKLVVHTAGTENASVELDGLSRDDAFRISEFLVPAGAEDGV